jgi:hypothetical protein
MNGMTMNAPEWVAGPSILSPENLQKVREALDRGYIVLEHMHFLGGRSLDKMFIEDLEDFMEYIKTKAKPGDLFVIYAMEHLFDRELYTVKAKYPDDQGRIPVGGAY